MQMNQYNTMWLTPPNTEGSGGFANIGDYPMPSIASQTVPGWEGSSFNSASRPTIARIRRSHRCSPQ
jgi:hypothetical protein